MLSRLFVFLLVDIVVGFIVVLLLKYGPVLIPVLLSLNSNCNYVAIDGAILLPLPLDHDLVR